MKDNLFEILLNLFEKSLAQLQRSHISLDGEITEQAIDDAISTPEENALYIKSAHNLSTRVFTYEEQMKLTKASYQFLMRMKLWNVIDADLFETIIDQLFCSDSRIVTLEETKWAIRTVLADQLNEKQLSFLDLVLYQREDKVKVH